MSGDNAPARGATAPQVDAADAHLLERFVQGQQVFNGRLLDVRRDTVAMPDGRHATREYVVHPGAVVVVPILDDGRLVMERQFRYPIGRVVLEFPAGKIDADEPMLVCAQRELTEETGYRASQWARAGITHNAMAYSTEIIEIWFARGLTPGPRQLDDGELIDLCPAHARRAGRGRCERRGHRRQDAGGAVVVAALARRRLASALVHAAVSGRAG